MPSSIISNIISLIGSYSITTCSNTLFGRSELVKVASSKLGVMLVRSCGYWSLKEYDEDKLTQLLHDALYTINLYYLGLRYSHSFSIPIDLIPSILSTLARFLYLTHSFLLWYTFHFV